MPPETAHHGLLSLLPVAVAIGLALWTRQVVLSLFLGTFTAALVAHGFVPWTALAGVIDPLLLDAIADRDHVKVTVFSLLVAATVRVMGDAGGTRALVDRVAGSARNRVGGMTATWVAGLFIFFDDYANCLVVGSSMRPLTDRLQISREKLAYLIDSTAAPMATVALVSTWIGYEVGLMDTALDAAGHTEINAYSFFLEGLPYRFYPLLALLFAGLIAMSGRDFGPMLQAEQAALKRGAPPIEGQAPPSARMWLAIVPVSLLVLVTGWSLWQQGVAKAPATARIFEIIGEADGYDAMLHGSLAALAAALVLALATGALSIAAGGKAVVEGMAELFEALIVLFFAWALAAGITQLGAAPFLVGVLGDSMPGWSLPAVTFVVSAAIAFATGTSFGTMGVLLPLVIPLAFEIDPSLAVASAASVLSGATWGDHCSPISDTTVLSSTGAGCDHGAHVRTQLPYALASGAISLLLCSLPAGLGLNPWLCLLLGSAACVLLVRLVGRRPGPAPALSAPASPRT